MNSANEKLRTIRTQKALNRAAYTQAKADLDEKYAEKMAILEKEEKELLEQFKEIPVEEIYKTKIRRYRKKPVIVEAYQTPEEKTIKTLEGTMKANKGDYIITGVKGEQYPCKPDIFDETYEEVDTE